jgi:hypothetical protein
MGFPVFECPVFEICLVCRFPATVGGLATIPVFWLRRKTIAKGKKKKGFLNL